MEAKASLKNATHLDAQGARDPEHGARPARGRRARPAALHAQGGRAAGQQAARTARSRTRSSKKEDVDLDRLYVKTAFADKAPTHHMVRWRPRAMGRATQIQKGMSHITDRGRESGRTDMGQKTHPYGFRLNVIRTWSSKWYEDKHYARWLHEDLEAA